MSITQMVCCGFATDMVTTKGVHYWSLRDPKKPASKPNYAAQHYSKLLNEANKQANNSCS